MSLNQYAYEKMLADFQESSVSPSPLPSPLPSPALVPNSFYSLADFRSSKLPAVQPPLSAPPPVGSSSVEGQRDREHQHFFGDDFPVPLGLMGSLSSIFYDNSNKSGDGGLSGGSSSGGEAKRQVLQQIQNNTSSSNTCSSSAIAVDNIMQQHRQPHQQQQPPPFDPLFYSFFGQTPPMNPTHKNNSVLNNDNVRAPPPPASSARHIQGKRPTPTHFSLKVFLGGLPSGLTTNVLQMNFAKFGNNIIDWPKKTPQQDRPPNGYAFVVFEEEASIFRMLRLCFESNNRLFFSVYSLGGIGGQLQHPVEIKVWQMKDTTFMGTSGWRKHRRFSVFVGGIPRTCTAAMLAYGIQEVFGAVAYATIELDRQHFYPKGAACVVFLSRDSYVRAIAQHEVVLGFGTFERKVEFKPFLATNMPCEKCASTHGTRYCAEIICLAYYCANCWKNAHGGRPSHSAHMPSTRFGSGGGGGGGAGGGRSNAVVGVGVGV